MVVDQSGEDGFAPQIHPVVPGQAEGLLPSAAVEKGSVPDNHGLHRVSGGAHGVKSTMDICDCLGIHLDLLVF